MSEWATSGAEQAVRTLDRRLRNLVKDYLDLDFVATNLALQLVHQELMEELPQSSYNASSLDGSMISSSVLWKYLARIVEEVRQNKAVKELALSSPAAARIPYENLSPGSPAQLLQTLFTRRLRIEEEERMAISNQDGSSFVAPPRSNQPLLNEIFDLANPKPLSGEANIGYSSMLSRDMQRNTSAGMSPSEELTEDTENDHSNHDDENDEYEEDRGSEFQSSLATEMMESAEERRNRLNAKKKAVLQQRQSAYAIDSKDVAAELVHRKLRFTALTVAVKQLGERLLRARRVALTLLHDTLTEMEVIAASDLPAQQRYLLRRKRLHDSLAGTAVRGVPDFLAEVVEVKQYNGPLVIKSPGFTLGNRTVAGPQSDGNQTSSEDGEQAVYYLLGNRDPSDPSERDSGPIDTTSLPTSAVRPNSVPISDLDRFRYVREVEIESV